MLASKSECDVMSNAATLNQLLCLSKLLFIYILFYINVIYSQSDQRMLLHEQVHQNEEFAIRIELNQLTQWLTFTCERNLIKIQIDTS